MLLAKDLLALLAKDSGPFNLEEMMRKPLSISGDRHINDVLGELRNQAAHFAVVLDEHGGVDGVVTMEDLIEEIVGEIFDETDSPEEEVGVTLTKTGDLLVDGGMALDDLNEEHGLSFPEGEYDTVAGFVIDHLGRIPEEGEDLQYNGSLIQVKTVEHNRIIELRIIEVESKDSSTSSKEEE